MGSLLRSLYHVVAPSEVGDGLYHVSDGTEGFCGSDDPVAKCAKVTARRRYGVYSVEKGILQIGLLYSINHRYSAKTAITNSVFLSCIDAHSAVLSQFLTDDTCRNQTQVAAALTACTAATVEFGGEDIIRMVAVLGLEARKNCYGSLARGF